MNFYGMYTLFAKEVWRFAKVPMQTLLTPVITVLLYLVVFASVLSVRAEVYPGVTYAQFLVPGLIIMAMVQNAFANTSSSLFQSKQNGNVIFVLLAPLSGVEYYLAMVAAAVVRGLVVGAGVWLAAAWFVPTPVYNLGCVLLFAMIGNAVLGALGLISAIHADKWDHIAAFQNFVILPLSFLSGVFYSIHDLPGIWPDVSRANPFFYLIDGFRYGFLGTGDAHPLTGIIIGGLALIAVSLHCLWLLHTGYKLRA